MEKFNRDIWPDRNALSDMSLVAPLVENEPFNDRFKTYEDQANRYKASYNRIGTLSLASSYLATLGLVYELMLAAHFGYPDWLFPVLFAISVVALVALSWLLAQGYKRKWLDARFLAEYLRCGKFQLYRVLADGATPWNLAEKVEAATARLLADATALGNSSTASFFNFQPTVMMNNWPPLPGPALDAKLLAQAREAYRLLRRDVQIAHLSARAMERTDELGRLKSVGDFTLVGGLVLSAFQLFQQATGLAETGPVATAVLGAVTLTLFVTGAVALVFERGRITRPDRDRYAHYAGRITLVSQGLETADQERFFQVVRAVEGACTDELSEFCRQGESSDFVI